jgi:hypothetical protein
VGTNHARRPVRFCLSVRLFARTFCCAAAAASTALSRCRAFFALAVAVRTTIVANRALASRATMGGCATATVASLARLSAEKLLQTITLAKPEAPVQTVHQPFGLVNLSQLREPRIQRAIAQTTSRRKTSRTRLSFLSKPDLFWVSARPATRHLVAALAISRPRI